MGKEKRGYISLILMVVITAATQVLALMKSSVVAGIFGASTEMDAYGLANSIASFLFGFISSGISTIVIPEYTKKNPDCKGLNSFLTYIYGGVSIIIVLMILLRTQLVGLISNRDEIFVSLVSDMLVIILLSQLLSSVASVTVAYFQCEGRYNLPKIINLICQTVVVISLLLLENLSIHSYALIIAAGVVINFIFDTVFALVTGWRVRPTLEITEEAKLLFKRFLPILLSTGVYRLSLFIDSLIASLLEAGSLTLINYSAQISTIVNTIIAGNLIAYLYPKLTKSIQSGEAQAKFWDKTYLFHAIVALMFSGFVAIGNEGVHLLFVHGSFTSENGFVVFVASAIYIFGQQASTIRSSIYQFFYAKGDTKTPASNSVLISVCNIVVSLILVYFIGLYGIVLGTIISSFISLTVIFINFKKKIGIEVPFIKILLNYLLTFLISVATIVVVLVTKYFIVFDSYIISILVFGVETLAVYFGLTFLLNKKIFRILKEV